MANSVNAKKNKADSFILNPDIEAKCYKDRFRGRLFLQLRPF
jgi:hypothetical protein